MPGASACSQVVLVWPGMMSVLPASAGIQNEWMTSAPVKLDPDRLPDRDVDLVGGGEGLRTDPSPR